MATVDPETNLPDLTEDLAATIDDLEDALEPLLSSPLPALNATLPTLDKAKLHILSAYALESLLFSALQASGADAKSHPIFPELARLKTYFGKVKAAEAAGEGKAAAGPTAKLDKDAAARFIRHGLSGNDRYDKERAERVAKEKARAALKARMMAEKVNKRFDDDLETKVQEELGRKRKAERENEEEEADDDDDDDEEKPQGAQADGEDVTMRSDEDHVDSENAEFYGEEGDTVMSTPAKEKDTPSKTGKKARKDIHQGKRSRKRRSTGGIKKQQELIIPERGEQPLTHSETFNALLEGTFAVQKKEKKKSGKKGGKKP